MNPDLAWAVWSSERQRRIEGVLERALPPGTAPPLALHRAMRYATLAGGKRLRPMLVYATGKTLGMAAGQLDPVATAIELKDVIDETSTRVAIEKIRLDVDLPDRMFRQTDLGSD